MGAAGRYFSRNSFGMKYPSFLMLAALVCLPNLMTAQHRVSIDLVQPIAGGFDSDFGGSLSYERKLTARTSFEIGLTGGELRDNNYYAYQAHLRASELAYRERTYAAGLLLGYRLYLRADPAISMPRGLFLSPYGKAYLTQTRRNFAATEEVTRTVGYLAGLGIGAGAVIPIRKWSITPFLGIGRGITSDRSSYQPGTEIRGLDHHLHLARIELSVGYSW